MSIKPRAEGGTSNNFINFPEEVSFLFYESFKNLELHLSGKRQSLAKLFA